MALNWIFKGFLLAIGAMAAVCISAILALVVFSYLFVTTVPTSIPVFYLALLWLLSK